MKNILKNYVLFIVSVIPITIFLTIFSKASASDVREPINVHFGENTPCILAVKAKYGCWPWDACAFYTEPTKDEVSK